MKRMIMAMVATLMMSSAAMAQDESQQRKERGDRKFDPTEMVKRRTDMTVEKYKLNEEQAKKLLELNTKYAKNMGPRMGRGGRPGGEGRGPRGGDKRPEMTEEQKAKMEEGRKKMEESMAAYNTELKAILTEEQYNSYVADMEKRAAERPRPERK